MTISADAADSDRLERNLALYRDLTMALRHRITLLVAGHCNDGKGVADLAGAHRRALEKVLDIEAGLGKRIKANDGGAGGELDLDAARAEVLARLAVRAAER
jgi:hypothetical protein